MEVVNTTCVMKSNVVLEGLCQKGETKSRDKSSNRSDHDGSTRRKDHVTSGSDYDTSGKTRIQQNLHAELAVDESAQGTRSNATCTDRDDCVHSGSLLVHQGQQGGIETRPVQIKEDCSSHGNIV